MKDLDYVYDKIENLLHFLKAEVNGVEDCDEFVEAKKALETLYEIIEGVIKMSDIKMVEITEEEFDRLQERDDFLSALEECAGVDNWEGIDQAHEFFREWREDSDSDLEETN